MGAVPESGSLEALGMSGTGHREPRGVRGACGVGVVGRRGRLYLAGDEAVASFGVVADASLAQQRSHDGGDGVVAGGGAFADLALRQRRIGFGERLEDAPLGGVGPRRGLGGVDLAQAQRGPLAVVGELDLDVVEAG